MRRLTSPFCHWKANGKLLIGGPFNDPSSATLWETEGVSQQVFADDGTIQIVKATVPRGSTSRFCRLRVDIISD